LDGFTPEQRSAMSALRAGPLSPEAAASLGVRPAALRGLARRGWVKWDGKEWIRNKSRYGKRN